MSNSLKSEMLVLNENYDGSYHKTFLRDLGVESENLSDGMIYNLFLDLKDNKDKMEAFYNVNLKPIQLNILQFKQKLDTYDIKVINRIEGWLTKISNLEVYADMQEGLNVQNIMAAHELYNDYIEDEKRYVEEDRKLRHYNSLYDAYKERDAYIKNKILINRIELIDEILVRYFLGSNLDVVDTFIEAVEALKEAIRRYKVNLGIDFKEFAQKIIVVRVKKYYSMKYGKKLEIEGMEEDHIKDKNFIMRKIISFVKTRMKIEKMYQVLNIGDAKYSEEVIDKTLLELQEIVKLLDDNDVSSANKNIELTVNIYDISVDLALYIYKNIKSIKDSLDYFLRYNKID